MAGSCNGSRCETCGVIHTLAERLRRLRSILRRAPGDSRLRFGGLTPHEIAEATHIYDGGLRSSGVRRLYRDLHRLGAVTIRGRWHALAGALA